MSNNNEKALVTFVVISFLEEWEPYMFMGMLKCIKNPRWKCIIWHDDFNPKIKAIIESFNEPRVTFVETPNRGSWGAYNRIDALKMVDTDFVIQTTIQEYYTPNIVDELEKQKTNDLIYWAVVHHSFDYAVLDSTPVRGQIDWSNFALRSHIARKVGINHPDSYIADGLFIEDVMKSGLVKRAYKIKKILNIKN